MKRLALTAVASGLAITAAAPATAAPTITIVTGSGVYGNDNVICAAAAPCTFSDTITFTTPTGYNLVSLTLSSAQVGTDTTTNIDFSTVTLNGVSFAIVSTGIVEFRNLLNQALVAGANNTLVISGTTGGNGSYAGGLSFANVAAVPEAATWAMMLAGFGAMGMMMRRRKTSVSFA